MTPDLERLNELYEKATPGPWTVWDSCSFRRISARGDGDVISGTVQKSDGHPDLLAKRDDLELLCALVNAWPALYAQLRQREGWVSVPREAMDWLMGEGDDFVPTQEQENRLFGPGRYWWRSEFQKRIAAAPNPPIAQEARQFPGLSERQQRWAQAQLAEAEADARGEVEQALTDQHGLIAGEPLHKPYHPSIAEQEVLRRALLASVKVTHPGVIAAEPPHAQAATAVSGDAAAHEQLATARKALEAILRTPAKPFPDAGSHSLEAWARAVHVAYCQMRFIAINALAAIDAERNRQ